MSRSIEKSRKNQQSFGFFKSSKIRRKEQNQPLHLNRTLVPLRECRLGSWWKSSVNFWDFSTFCSQKFEKTKLIRLPRKGMEKELNRSLIFCNGKSYQVSRDMWKYGPQRDLFTLTVGNLIVMLAPICDMNAANDSPLYYEKKRKKNKKKL